MRLVPSTDEKTVENEPTFIAVQSLSLPVRVMHCLEGCAAIGLFVVVQPVVLCISETADG